MTDAPTPTLTGRHVRLRPVFPGDYEYLYALATHELTGWRWRYRGTSPSPELFQQQLWQNCVAQFIVEHIADGQRVGHVQAFDANDRNGYCHFGVLLDPALERSAWGIEALLLFLDYLFTVFNYRKLYAEIPEFNYDQFASGAGSIFKVEGHLKAHDWHAGRYWDSYLIALYREDFERDWHPRVVQLRASQPAGVAP
jgi:RimJ/RimL family protein N-acetyltransferase